MFAQVFTGAGQAGLDGTDGHAERRRDFVVAQPVDFSEHQNGSLLERQFVERFPYVSNRLMLFSGLIWFGERPHVRQIAMSGHVFIQWHLLRLMTPAPPSAAIRSLRHDHPIDPGPQRRLASELAQRTEHPQEDFLGEIQRFLRVGEQVQGKLIHHPLVIGYQAGASRLIASQAFLRTRPVRRPFGLSFGHAGGFGPRESSNRPQGNFL